MKLFSFDIETDTDSSDGVRRGLDPSIGGITTIAMAREIDGHLDAAVLNMTNCSSSEKNVLAEANTVLCKWIDEAADESDEGIEIATWNGFVFDIPFVFHRAAYLGVPIGLEMKYDSSIPVKYKPLPGYKGGYRGAWKTPSGGIAHFSDIMFSYKEYCKEKKISNGLKPTARSVLGLEPIEVDRANMHLLDSKQLEAYAISDVDITLQLAKLRPQYGKLI
jgi:hypothetical protein